MFLKFLKYTYNYLILLFYLSIVYTLLSVSFTLLNLICDNIKIIQTFNINIFYDIETLKYENKLLKRRLFINNTRINVNSLNLDMFPELYKIKNYQDSNIFNKLIITNEYVEMANLLFEYEYKIIKFFFEKKLHNFYIDVYAYENLNIPKPRYK